MSRWLTAKEIAEALGVGRRHAAKLIDKHKCSSRQRPGSPHELEFDIDCFPNTAPQWLWTRARTHHSLLTIQRSAPAALPAQAGTELTGTPTPSDLTTTTTELTTTTTELTTTPTAKPQLPNHLLPPAARLAADARTALMRALQAMADQGPTTPLKTTAAANALANQLTTVTAHTSPAPSFAAHHTPILGGEDPSLPNQCH